MDYAYYYTKISHLIDAVIEEKEDILSDLFELVIKLNTFFPSNRNRTSALILAYNYIISVLKDINREHDVYLYIQDYLGNLDDPSKLSKRILIIIEKILNELEDTVDTRILDYARFLSFYDEIFDSKILTNRNYLYPTYQDKITEEEKNRLLTLLPQKK